MLNICLLAHNENYFIFFLQRVFYLAQQLSKVCRRQERFQITNITFGSKVNVTYNTAQLTNSFFNQPRVCIYGAMIVYGV